MSLIYKLPASAVFSEYDSMVVRGTIKNSKTHVRAIMLDPCWIVNKGDVLGTSDGRKIYVACCDICRGIFAARPWPSLENDTLEDGDKLFSIGHADDATLPNPRHVALGLSEENGG